MHFRGLKKTAGDLYINEPIDTDKDGNALTLMDIVADDDSIADRVDLMLKTDQLYQYLSECLDERERTIIKYRYGLFGCASMTQREVARRLGISRSYVSQRG